MEIIHHSSCHYLFLSGPDAFSNAGLDPLCHELLHHTDGEGRPVGTNGHLASFAVEAYLGLVFQHEVGTNYQWAVHIGHYSAV